MNYKIKLIHKNYVKIIIKNLKIMKKNNKFNFN